MKKIVAIISIVLQVFFCYAQTKNLKTFVVKVRIPLAKATINCTESFFYLEKESAVRVTIKGKNAITKVFVKGAQIRSVKNDVYQLRFYVPGKMLVEVYQYKYKDSLLLAKKEIEIRPPSFYFCGVKLDSSSSKLSLNGCNLYAYSDVYKRELQVIGFEMYYERMLVKKNFKKSEPVLLKADTCKLSAQMKRKIIDFQPSCDKIYFANIRFYAPDGTKKALSPVELIGKTDTSDLYNANVIFSIKKKLDW